MHSTAPSSSLLLDRFPLLRATRAEDACTRIGQWFSPHRLGVQGDPERMDVRLNKVVLRELSVHVLRYGAEVDIDPGQRGDFYMLQIPLAGRARLQSGQHLVDIDPSVLSVLQPRTPTRMQWSANCAMILLQVPTLSIERRVHGAGEKLQRRFEVAASRKDPRVAAWWSAAEDMVRNLDAHALQWLSSDAAACALEEFLLSAFTSLLYEENRPVVDAGAGACRSLARAKAYVQDNLAQAISLDALACEACVSPRTLEALFRRFEGTSPMSYVRQQRLEAVHEALRTGKATGVTEAALQHGFVHLGRFAALYRERYGCTPSQTLRKAG